MLKLKQSIDLSGGCDRICITDISGVYHATNNPTGWGSPNSLLTDATVVEIRMYKYLGDDTWDEMYSIDASSVLPNTTETVFCFTSAEIKNAAGDSYGTSFSDGVYKVHYYIECGSQLIYIAEEYMTAKCSVECCRNEALSKVANACDDKELEAKFSEINLQIDLLKRANECGDIQAIYDYLVYIDKLCASCNCRC